MEEVATLVIQVRSESASEAEKRLRELGFQAKRTERATDGLNSSFAKMFGPLARIAAGYFSFQTALSGINKLVTTARTFEVLEAQLKTATGSAENAAFAFNALKQFAQETPYDLAQTVDAFIKLVNLGLTPSERALRSYGNTASALGQELSAMVNAVSKAVTGEFEPLKAFGIKAKTEADGVTFIFRGMATKVNNDVRSIEKYFTELGENNFASSMTERMKTLDGAISNLGDAWDQMFATIANAGAGEVIQNSVRAATAAIEELTAMIASGQLGGYIEALGIKFKSFGEAAKTAIDFITSELARQARLWGLDSEESVKFLTDAFTKLPENVTAVVKAIGATLGLLAQYGEAAGKLLYNSLIRWVEYGGTTIDNLVTELMDRINDPFGEGSFDYTGEQAKAFEKFSTSVSQGWQQATSEIKFATEAYGEVVTEIMDERDATIAAYEAKIEASKKLRDEYDKRIEAEREAAKGQDRLQQFKVGGDGGIFSEAQRNRLNALRDSFDEEIAVRRKYAENVKLLDDARAAGEIKSDEDLAAAKASLRQRLDVELHGAQEAKFEQLQSQYQTEQDMLQTALDRRQISEETFLEKSRSNWATYTKNVSNLASNGARQLTIQQLEMHSQVLGLASDISSQLSALAGENNAAAKAMFVASKAIAIAQALVYTELAATRALAEGGFYLGIPMASVIRGLGYASIGLMAGTAIAEGIQKFEHGGMIPAGKTGLVGEAGAELIRGPAVVSSARTTADMGQGSTGGGAVQVVVNNYGNEQVEVTETQTSDGKLIELVVGKAKKEIAAGIRTGGNEITKALEGSYGLRRGAA